IFFDAGADLPHHLEIDIEKIIAAHAWLARDASGDDAHIGAFNGVIAVGANELGVEIVDRRGFGDIERLTLWDSFHDVEHHDVTELLEANEMRQRAADLARTDQRDFVTRHEGKTLDFLLPRSAAARWLTG